MHNRWKVAGAIGAGAAGFWFVTFVVEWHIRTNWQHRWYDAAIRAWANFAMLEWIGEFQTLLAGCLALVAGSFVWIVHQAQTMNSNLYEARRNAAHVRATFTTLEQWFGNLVIVREPEFEISPLVDKIETALGVLGQLEPYASRFAYRVTFHIGYQLRKFQDGTTPEAKDSAVANIGCAAAVASSFFNEATHFLDDEGRMRQEKVPLPKHTLAFLKARCPDIYREEFWLDEYFVYDD